jgi:hypothetical protein
MNLAARRIWTFANWLKVIGLTVLYIALLSVNYSAITFSNAATKTPIQLILVAFIDTLLLSYFALRSRWKGWKEWGAVFAVLYGMVYVLTAAETFYLGSILSASMALALLVNGAITSVIFAGALAWVFGGKGMQGGMSSTQDARKGVGIENRRVGCRLLASLLCFRVHGLHASWQSARPGGLHPRAEHRFERILTRVSD